MRAFQAKSVWKNDSVWAGARRTQNFVSGRDVNQFLTSKSYVRSTISSFLTKGCGVSYLDKSPACALIVLPDKQNARENRWVLCVFGVRGCTLILYFGQELLLDPAIIARIYAWISAVTLAFAGSALGSASAFAIDAPLTFTPANWNTPQTVTATTINDAVVEGTHSCAPASITATGGSFNTANGTPPTITINDDDTVVQQDVDLLQ